MSKSVEAAAQAQSSFTERAFHYAGTRVPEFISIGFFNRTERFINPVEGLSFSIAHAIKLANEGFKIIQLSNHQAYFDIVASTMIAREIVRHSQLEGFDLVLASTLMDGKQGLAPDLAFKNIVPYLKASGVDNFIPTVREKDKQLYTEDKLRELTEQSRNALQRLNSNRGLIAFLEGNMDGGRPKIGNPNEIQGMQEVRDTRFAGALANYLRTGTRFAILPVGIHGGFQVSDPVSKTSSLDRFVDLTRNIPHASVLLNADEPITDEQLIADVCGMSYDERRHAAFQLIKNPKSTIDHVMYKIATLLPEEGRGYYQSK